MGIILGIDIGGSTTKIVGLEPDGNVQSMLRIRAEDQLTSLYGALGNYLKSNHLALSDIDRIILTGVGSSYVEDRIYGIPTHKVSEFHATGAGGLALTGQSEGIVVSMGTGTAFMMARDNGEVRHIGGTGIGGGTLGGLCHKLIGMERFGQIKKVADGGDLSKIDLTIGDLAKDTADTLTMDMTASNFGNLAEDATPSDLAAGAINLVLQAIGTMTVFACQCCQTNTVILTGSMTTLPQAEPNFQLFQKLYGYQYMIPENATFATAIGAALYDIRFQNDQQ